MQISEQGLALIKGFEGFCAHPYLCPAGRWTIGYGHLISDEEDYSEGVSEEESEAILKQDVAVAEQAVCRLVHVVLKQGQFDALVSLVYNIGIKAFSDSTLLKYINLSNFLAAAHEFTRWDRIAGRKALGLIRRRMAEMAMFSAS